MNLWERTFYVGANGKYRRKEKERARDSEPDNTAEANDLRLYWRDSWGPDFTGSCGSGRGSTRTLGFNCGALGSLRKATGRGVVSVLCYRYIILATVQSEFLGMGKECGQLGDPSITPLEKVWTGMAALGLGRSGWIWEVFADGLDVVGKGKRRLQYLSPATMWVLVPFTEMGITQMVVGEGLGRKWFLLHSSTWPCSLC